MNADRVRALLLTLPHVQETMQWGDNLVFWVGNKAIGGKMFVLLALDAASGSGQPLVSFAAGPERYHALLERDGLVPAPYFARIFWTAATRWDALGDAEWRELLAGAHELTLHKLPARTRNVLEIPVAEQRQLVMERRALLARRKQDSADTKAQRRSR